MIRAERGVPVCATGSEAGTDSHPTHGTILHGITGGVAWAKWVPRGADEVTHSNDFGAHDDLWLAFALLLAALLASLGG